LIANILILLTDKLNKPIKTAENILFSLISLMLLQPTKLAYKICMRITIIFVFLCLIISIYYKSFLLDNILRQPKQWCETLECFADPNYNRKFFIRTDKIAYNELKSLAKTFRPAEMLLDENRSEFASAIDSDNHDWFLLMDCKKDYIVDSYTAETESLLRHFF